MANYAHVENDQIVGVYDVLPANWRNISNFYVLPEEILQTFGWHKLEKQIPAFDSATQKLSDPIHMFDDGVAYERFAVISKNIPASLTEEELFAQQQQRIEEQWNIVRETRAQMMRDFEWRYTRYERHLRLGLEQIDALESLDAYMQQLVDITLNDDPFNIIWPEYTEN
jgi:hypothetical protein